LEHIIANWCEAYETTLEIKTLATTWNNYCNMRLKQLKHTVTSQAVLLQHRKKHLLQQPKKTHCNNRNHLLQHKKTIITRRDLTPETRRNPSHRRIPQIQIQRRRRRRAQIQRRRRGRRAAQIQRRTHLPCRKPPRVAPLWWHGGRRAREGGAAHQKPSSSPL
jgi:hypothetical protein